MENDATKQEVIESPEEVAAFLSDMSLDEWRKATTTNKRKACPDSEGLGFWGDERFTVGSVDEVNGPNSAVMPEFLPTRYELIQLAKYWATIALDLSFDYFLYTQTGSSEWRLDAFARRRVGRIGEILGQDEINKVIDQAYEEYGKEQDPRAWSIFLNGTPEEQEAFQDEIQQKIGEQIERDDRSPLTPEELLSSTLRCLRKQLRPRKNQPFTTADPRSKPMSIFCRPARIAASIADSCCVGNASGRKNSVSMNPSVSCSSTENSAENPPSCSSYDRATIT